MAFQDMAQHTWVWAGQEKIDSQGHQLYRMAQGLQLCWDLGGCPQAPRVQEQLKSLGQQLRAPVEHEGKAASDDQVNSPFSPASAAQRTFCGLSSC